MNKNTGASADACMFVCVCGVSSTVVSHSVGRIIHHKALLRIASQCKNRFPLSTCQELHRTNMFFSPGKMGNCFQ